MAIIPQEEKVFMVSNSTNTTYSGSAALKAMQQWYTMQDISDSIVAPTAPYKVFTALLTQSGTGNPDAINNDSLVVGTTYEILNTDGNTVDFTNVGAPNNLAGTSFIATGTTPTSWGQTNNGLLGFNTGAPVATVLENTIGNIWFTYVGAGTYNINSNGLFTENKTGLLIAPQTQNAPDAYVFQFNRVDDNELQLQVLNADESGPVDDILSNQMIEIRVYN